MLSLKRKYESVIIVSIKLSEDNIKQVVDKFKNLILKNATLIDFQEWGKRKLVYPVNHETEGYYVLFSFESDRSFPAELTRQYKIDSAIVRFMTVLADDYGVPASKLSSGGDVDGGGDVEGDSNEKVVSE